MFTLVYNMTKMALNQQSGPLSLASQFFHWSLQYPSGGLLNIFFAPKDQGMFQINPTKEKITSALKFLQFVLFKDTTDLSVSKALLRENLSTHNTPTASNREGVIIWPLLITLFLTLALLIILGWRLSYYKARGPRKESDEMISIFESRGENGSDVVKKVRALSFGVQTFLYSGLSNGQKTISEAFRELEDALTIHLQNRSNDVIDILYRHLQLKEMLSFEAEMVRLMDVRVAAFKSGNTALVNKVERVSHFLTDLISAERNLTRVLKNECGRMEQCAKMIISLSAFTRHLTPLPVGGNSLPQLITALHSLKVKLDPWFLLVRNLHHSLTQLRTRRSNHSSTHTIDLSPTVEAVWRQVEMQVISLNRSVQSLEQEVVSSLDKTARTCVTAAVSSVGGVFACLHLFLGVFVGGFLHTTVKERCLRKPRRVRKGTSACRSSVIHLCAFLFITAMLLTFLVICTTFGSSLLYAEGCVYLQEDKHLAIFDSVLSGYMQGIWTQISGETVFGVPPPKNLLTAVVRDCGRSDVGLFALIGWNSFPDLPTLLHSENVQGAIQEERYDLMETLQQVQKEMASEEGLSHLNNDLSQLIAAHDEARNLTTLQSAVPSISASGKIFIEICLRAPEMKVVMGEIASAAQSLESLKEVEVLMKSFLLWLVNTATMLRNSSGLDTLVSDVYTDTTWHLNALCEPLLRPYVERLFQCHALPGHFTSLIDSVCGEEGLLARIYAWGVVVWIEIILLFLFLLPLIFGITAVNEVLAE
uniref:Prominin-1-A-like n=1 Tax=Echinococcus canadensis TaxID=519352 RepID=A0A915EV89_9CEST